MQASTADTGISTTTIANVGHIFGRLGTGEKTNPASANAVTGF
jgi:hypothetical protein